jgi:heme o synthase
MFKNYYTLTKPGIVYGNVFTAFASFLFASRWLFSTQLLLATVIGIALVIASACVFNNYIDRDLDKKMQRTKDRALVTGSISSRSALIFGAMLGFTGFLILCIYVNILTAQITFIGFFFYLVPYGITKRKSHWGTVVGSVSGAVPIVAGYTAVTGSLDAAAFILFCILVLWQMPHFYAIAIYRSKDYRNAGIPVLPAVKGVGTTRWHIIFYILAYLLALSMPTVFGYTGYSYLVAVLLSTLVWLVYALKGFGARDQKKWARTLFFISLIVLVIFCVALSVGSLLP